jgi:hypothetical protein
MDSHGSLGGQRLHPVILDHLAGSLHPTPQDFGCTRISNSPLPETTLDLRVTRRLTNTAGCAAAAEV